MSEPADIANQRLAELQQGFAQGAIDLGSYRRGRRLVLNELVGRDSVEPDDTRPQQWIDDEITNPGSPTATAPPDQADALPGQSPAQPRQRGRHALYAGVAGAVVAVLLGILLIADLKPDPEGPEEGATRAGATGSVPAVDPEQALTALVANPQWSSSQVDEFVAIWAGLSVEQRFELRLLTEFAELRQLARAKLSARNRAGESDPALERGLRKLLKEIE